MWLRFNHQILVAHVNRNAHVAGGEFVLKLLLFVEPKPLPEHLFRNLYWLEFPLRILRQLKSDAAGRFEFHLSLPRRFLNRVRGNPIFDRNIYSINEAPIVERIFADGMTLREVWNSEFHGNTLPGIKKSIDQIVCSSLPDLNWDIVLTFGEECRYSFADRAMKLNIETSPFSRPPFKHSFFMDHCGLFRNSAPSCFFGPAATPLPGRPDSTNDLAKAIRTTALSVIERSSKLPFKRRFDQYLLLPLQASNYSSFDAQCDYNSQIDYLLDVANQFDRASGKGRTGLVVTEHPNVDSIDNSNRFGIVLAGLHDMFPNLEYLPRAKFFSSASFELLNQVDWVWTVASNVGPVASFLGKTVGSPVDSHISYAANEHSVGDTVRSAHGSNEIRPAFQWMFNNYIIPSQKIEEPNWIADYLIRRHQAFLSHSTSIDSFVPTGCGLNDFIDVKSDTSTKSVHYKSLINEKIAFYGTRTRWRIENLRARSGQRTFVLLNDTAELESYRHIGCNHVSTAIYSNMHRLGFRMTHRVNKPDDVQVDGIAPEWAVINGEGSFHHDSPRARQLLEIAIGYKQRGSKVALVNSIWEANAPELAGMLKDFDVVAVRDKNSRANLAGAGIDAMLSPDFSLGQWQPLDTESRKHRKGLMFTDNIVYERALKLFDASLQLGGSFWLLDHRWVDQFDQDGCFSAGARSALSTDFLTKDGQTDQPQLVVTGRFHVAMACIALGNIFVYVESNTDKITHLCNDIGLPTDVLNVTSLVDDCDWSGLGERIRTVITTFESYLPAILDFRRKGLASISDVFRRFSA